MRTLGLYMLRVFFIGFLVISSISAEEKERSFQGIDGTSGSIKIYIDALLRGDFDEAATQLMYPKVNSIDEKKENFLKLTAKIKKLHKKYGKMFENNENSMPMGNYRTSFIGMIPPNKHPFMSSNIIIPVVFTKEKKVMLNFMIGEIGDQKGIYEVQYWCFSCLYPKIIVEKKDKTYNLIISHKGKKYPVFNSIFDILMPEISDDFKYATYISNENGESVLVVQNLQNGKRVPAIRSVTKPLEIGFSKNKKEVYLKSLGEKVKKYNYSSFSKME